MSDRYPHYDPMPRPATEAGLLIWVKRASGFHAGYADTFAYADDLAARCNTNHPSDPAQVYWAPSLTNTITEKDTREGGQ